MVFIARFKFPEKKPAARVYLHSAGFEEIFKNDISNAEAYLSEVLEANSNLIMNLNYDYILAAIWGKVEEEKEKMFIDLFCYRGIE